MIIWHFAGLGTAAVLTATLLTARPAEAQSASPLVIQPSGTKQVQLLWPATTNFNVLQEIPGFDGTNTWMDVPEAPSPLGLFYSVREATTNGAMFYRLAQRGTPGVTSPPDPASVAPALAPNVFNAFGPSTAFLYSGPNPIQVGVAPGTIQALQAAVLRGTVRGRNNGPLPGVRVALLNHPEFGYTYTRTNGMFDLAVNASQYTVDFAAIGYLPAQRQAQVIGHSYLMLPDVGMIGLDPMATSITLGSNAPAQVAKSTPQSDMAGTRSTTVYFPAGTSATMVLPDGSTQPLSSVTVRITEYTVGTNGPTAMPAPLPPTSAYTYCAEFSTDEALAAGATKLLFSQPVSLYLDNFLNMPVGTLVPVGIYDRTSAEWMATSNGVIMQILGSSNGIASIDLNGSGAPASSNALAASGFTTAELEELASLYGAGKTLWRFQQTYDESFDANYTLVPPNKNLPGGPHQPSSDPNDNSGPNDGTLNYSSQVFTETIPLVGVPFNLNYSSARVPDYKVKSQATVPAKWVQPPIMPTCQGPGVCVATPGYLYQPPNAIRIDLNVAGEPDQVQILPATATQATVAWDGKDAYRREVGGSVAAQISVSYEYTNWDYGVMDTGSGLATEFPDLFGNYINASVTEGHVGTTLGISQTFQMVLTYPDHRALGFGGWSPSILHRFDPVGGLLYYGDGRIDTVPESAPQSGFQSLFVGPGPRAMAAAPDGTVYFVAFLSSGNNETFLCRRSPGGSYEILSPSLEVPGVVYPNKPPPYVATNDNWTLIDGQPVTNVSFGSDFVRSMAVGPDGSLYVSDGSAIARLTPDGIWHVIMGLNAQSPPVYQPDGTFATNSYATEFGQINMAVGPDGSLFYTCYFETPDGSTYFFPLRRIAPNGKIYTVYGSPGVSPSGSSIRWFDFYGSSAYATPSFNDIAAFAVGSDGTIYVSPRQYADGGGMFQITPGGILLPFMSQGPNTGAGEGYNPLTQASYIQGDEGKVAQLLSGGGPSAQVMAAGPDGSVYFSDGIIVWRVNPAGVVERVAGRYAYTAYDPPNHAADNADPLNTVLYPVTGLQVLPDNTLVILRENAPDEPQIVFYPGRTSQNGLLNTPLITQQVPSEDGSEIYVFSTTGQHLSTLDSLTGATKWSFQYDTNNFVVTMTDSAGLTTVIQRDAAGHPTEIVGPSGQITKLGVDANGFLNSVSTPANETETLTYTPGGLLSSITGPLGETYRVQYNPLGLVTGISDPLGGGLSDDVTNLVFLGNGSFGLNVVFTNSLGNTVTRQLTLLSSGSTSQTNYEGTLVSEQSIVAPDGSQTANFSDGSQWYLGLGPDPRFGRQVQEPISMTVQLSPTSPEFTASIQRSAALTNSGQPLSFTALTNVVTINGNTYTCVYTASNRTATVTSPAGRTVSKTLDSLGRLSSVAQPGYPTSDYAYDSLGRLEAITNSSSAGAAITTFSYNSLGQSNLITDALGNSLHLAYDADGRVIQEILPDGAVASITYDRESDPTSIAPPGRPAHTFQYNAVGLLTNYTPPLAGPNSSISYLYDSERELTQAAFPDGQVAALQYGWFGQLTQMALGNGPTLSYNYGGLGGFQLVAVTNSDGDVIQYGYTGPIQTSVSWSGSINGQVAIQLNDNFLPASVSVDDTSVSYSYNPDMLITQVGALSITNDPASGFIIGTSNGVATDQRLFDDRGLLTNSTVIVNGAPLWSISYAYDILRRITNRVEALNSQTQTNGYVYDVRGRLQQVWLNGALNVTYSYDSNGNRLSRNDETATYDAQDRVLTYNGSTFTWSPNGTLLSRVNGGQTTDYTYDLRGALTAVSISGGPQITYIIDAEARRIGKQVNGTLQRGWLWQGDALVAELDGNSSLKAMFVYAADSPAPSYMITPTNTYRILSDERGSVRLVVDTATGAIAQQLVYDEFGRVTADSNPGFQPFGFAGGQYDPDTGLVRFGARDYSSETGHWTGRDPKTFSGGSFNLYAYASSDPINVIDRLGTGPNHEKEEEEDPRLVHENHWGRRLGHETGVTAVAELTGLANPAHVILATDLAAQGVGETINYATDGGLDKSMSAVKDNEGKPIDMRGEQAKKQPFEPFPWLRGW
jgi:RHS repeat-associated protein